MAAEEQAAERSPDGNRVAHIIAVVVAVIGASGLITAALIEAGVLFPHHHDPAGSIQTPVEGSRVGREFTVAGRLSNIPAGDHIWLAVQVGNLLYPKEPGIEPTGERFSEQIVEGGSPPGGRFSLLLLRVDEEGQASVESWLSALREGKEPSGLVVVPGSEVLGTVANLHLEG